MPRATTPATVAATAATAGTVRVRCRAASRTAYRRVSGKRPETRESPASSTGTSRIMPRTDRIADPAMNSSPEGALAPTRRTRHAEPHQQRPDQRRANRRRPVAPPPGQHRDDVLPRGDSARGRPQRATRSRHRTRRPPPAAATGPGTGRTTRPRCSGPAEGPGTRARCPGRRRATPPSRRGRGHWRAPRAAPAVESPPVEASRARMRACRRAPTANAGPASRTTSMRAITTTRTATASVVWSIPSPVGAHLLRNRRGGRWVEQYCPRQHGGSPRVEPPYVVPGHRRTARRARSCSLRRAGRGCPTGPRRPVGRAGSWTRRCRRPPVSACRRPRARAGHRRRTPCPRAPG